MTEEQITARLVKIDAAIDYILTAKTESYNIAGRALTRLRLEVLEKMRDKYQGMLDAAQGNVKVQVARFRSPG